MYIDGKSSPGTGISQLGVSFVSADGKQLSLPFNPVWCLLSDGSNEANSEENKHADSLKVYL